MNQVQSKKRSLFSKEALAKVSVGKDPVDFFSCAKKVYPKLLEEEQEKRRNKIRITDTQQLLEGLDSNKETSEDCKSNKNTEEGLFNYSEGSLLPLKLSSPQENGQPKNLCSRKGQCSRRYSPQPVATDSVAKGCESSNPRKPQNSTISLESEEEEEISSHSLNSLEDNASLSPSSCTSFTDNQPEIANEKYFKFIQEARERERLKAQQRLITANRSTNSSSQISLQKAVDIFHTDDRPLVESDPTVELLITCQIDGTRPLRVKRKLSQRLKEARLTWCEKQSIKTDTSGKSLEEVIFLTWQGKRLFDATTCRSLGLKVDAYGKLCSDKDGANSNGNIHLEAWTEDALRAKEEKVATSQRLNEDINSAEEQLSQKNTNPLCKLIMRAKDMEPCKLAVKSTTTIAQMANAFRKAKSISEDTKISLYFDGDLLDPNSTIEETELGDFDNIDTVDVHFK